MSVFADSVDPTVLQTLCMNEWTTTARVRKAGTNPKYFTVTRQNY